MLLLLCVSIRWQLLVLFRKPVIPILLVPMEGGLWYLEVWGKVADLSVMLSTWDPHHQVFVGRQRIYIHPQYPGSKQITYGVWKNENNVLWRCATSQWSKITVLASIFRYSHSAHVINEKLVVVGGVWLQADGVPGVAVIYLNTGSCVEIQLDTVSYYAHGL